MNPYEQSADEADFTNLIRSVGPSPCDRCPTRRRCGSEHLACRRFAEWARTGRDDAALPREPTRAQWSRLFESPEGDTHAD